LERDFPQTFWWGTAASSPQAEGAAPASDWLAWERAGKVPPSGNGNGFGTRYADDFGLYAGHGLLHHRLGIEWARIEPEEGRRDAAAVGHYRDMLGAARAAGIEPWVCLHHFVLPAWVAGGGAGFRDERARSYYWRRHLEFVAETYGDLVAGWKPINEPVAYAVNAFFAGIHSPGARDWALTMDALEGAHLANLEAWRVLRQTGRPVSTIHALSPLFAADNSPQSAALVDRVDHAAWRSWIRALREGVLELPGRAPLSVPDFQDAFDLIGFSYYSALALTADLAQRPYPPDGEVGPMGYVPWSPGVGMVLDRLAAELPGKPILVAEHGVGGDDDARRCAVLTDSLRIVADRLAAGMDIRGFFHWTGVDNYEWAHGWNTPFGLFDTDRRPRPSARLMRAVATSGRLESTTAAPALAPGRGR
jgi:beta-glucosidase